MSYVGHNEAHGLDLRFSRSASRHGIANERAAYVVEHCPLPFYSANAAAFDGVVIYLGPDWNGVPLEVAAIEQPDGTLTVIHAMRLRRSFLQDYRRVMRWHES